MPQSNLPSFEYADIAASCESADYNAVIDLMENEKLIPMYESRYFDIYRMDCTNPDRSYGWSPEMCTIFIEFMDKNNIHEFRMLG